MQCAICMGEFCDYLVIKKKERMPVVDCIIILCKTKLFLTTAKGSFTCMDVKIHFAIPSTFTRYNAFCTTEDRVKTYRY